MRRRKESPNQLVIDFIDSSIDDGIDSGSDIVQQLLTPDQIYQFAEKQIQLFKEDRRIERKSPKIHQQRLGEYFSMWANTSPHGGIIAVGISNKGEVIGCKSLEMSTLNQLESTGYDRCADARYETKRVAVVNEKGEQDFVLLFRVYYHETKLVETCEGKAFHRIGESCIELKTDDEKRQMRIDKGEVQHEQEPCQLSFPDDFDMELVNRWSTKVRELRGLSDSHSVEKLLEMFRLGRRRNGQFRPNIACMLLFATDPVEQVPGCRVEILRFDGTTEYTGEKRNTVKEESIQGCIPLLIDASVRFVSGQIRTFQGLGKDNRFQTLPEYPETAWHEAIVNACVHRSYNLKNMKIFVRIFDDRFEVESPGPFPPAVTPADIYDAQHSRNPFIMDALRILGLVKGYNEGVKRMRDTMLEMQLPAPEFTTTKRDASPANVKVVLRNNIAFRRLWLDTDVAGLVGASVFKSLTEKEKLILNYLAIHQEITVNRTQVLTQHNWHTSRNILRGMVAKGILKYVRKPGRKVDRQSKYKLNDERPPIGNNLKRVAFEEDIVLAKGRYPG